MPPDLSVSKSEFIEDIRQVVYSGCGINPLVGSGASAASGIIMGIEFSDYLAYVVQKTLDRTDAWDLRRNGWPPYPTSEDYEKTREWTLREFKKSCEEDGYTVDSSNGKVTGIRPKSDVNADHTFSSVINCPGAPNNIRSPYFHPHDSSQHHLASLLRTRRQTAERYEPLWLRPEQSKTSEQWIQDIGLRSLFDWRATLRFLSRLKKELNGRVTLARAKGSVVDRFNTYISVGKQPNLTHKMLAALARPLRMRTLLTTNFDTLLEDAFAQSGHGLTKFFVSKKGHLPDPFLVRAQPSIIKLHGELLETRADFSLDDDPAIFDKRCFLSYFVDAVPGTEHFRSTLSNLLVLGFSASDMRIIRMLQYLLDETSRFQPANRPKVFWLCVSDSDKRRVDLLFQKYQGRVVSYQTARPDLLLLELYQRLTRALPGAGQTYEYNHNVPPSRTAEAPFLQRLDDSLEHIRDDAVTAFSRLESGDEQSKLRARDALSQLAGHTLFERIQGRQVTFSDRHEIDHHFRICDLKQVAASVTRDKDVWRMISKSVAPENILQFNSTCGALEALNIVHAKLVQSSKYRCLWFELADYVNVDALLRDVLRSIALRVGRFQREQVVLHPLTHSIESLASDKGQKTKMISKLADHLKDLCKVQRLSPCDWPILLYGRDLAGSCVNWESNAWTNEVWYKLPVLIGALGIAGFPIVLAHSCRNRIVGEGVKLKQSLLRAESINGKRKLSEPEQQEFEKYLDLDGRSVAEKKKPNQSSMPELPDFLVATTDRNDRLAVFSNMCEQVFKRCLNNIEYRRFIYASCLFRQSRRPSALFYEAVQPCRNRFNISGIDNDVLRSEVATMWVKELEKERVFYGKAGGTSWMHRDIRIALGKKLDRVFFDDVGGIRAHCHEVARTHFWIADWYEKAFFSTGFAKPVLESLHHRYQAAKLAKFSLPRNVSIKNAGKTVRDHRFLLLRSSVNELSKTLLVARPQLKLWLANAHGFPMFELSELMSVSEDSPSALLKKLIDGPETKACEFDADQIKELRICLDFLRNVLSETQRSVQNEADLKISGQILAQPFSASCASIANLQVKLDTVLGPDYIASSVWNSRVKTLLGTISQTFKIARPDVKVCIPLGTLNPLVATEKYAKHKGLAIAQLGASCQKLPGLLVVIEAVAYAQLRRAKFLSHAAQLAKGISTKNHKPSEIWQRTDVRKEWLRVTRLCNLGIDWCKHLPPNFLRLDAEVRVRLHSYYAVALANLDRFNEAHRHLNEGLGIQSKQEWISPQIEQAKIGLRRAEVLLTEAHRISRILHLVAKMLEEHLKTSEKLPTTQMVVEWLDVRGLRLRIDKPATSDVPDEYVAVQIHPSARSCIETNPDRIEIVVMNLRRLLVSILDDAWFTIENSERALSGQSQSSLWWGRIAMMKLRACGYQIDVWGEKADEKAKHRRPPELRMLAYRHRRINPQMIWQVYENARLNNNGKPYRELRLIRYVATSLQVFACCLDELRFVRECIAPLELSLSTNFEKLPSPEFSQIVRAANEAVKEARRWCDLPDDKKSRGRADTKRSKRS